MLGKIRKLVRRKASPKRQAFAPEGERLYVIGDVHGRADLFAAMIEAVEQDDRAAARADTTVVLLGDLIDRGPDSAGVVEIARNWGSGRKLRYLAGNHEQMFLESFDDIEVLRHFLKHGGRETILSYGMAPDVYGRLSLEELQAEMHQIVPQQDRQFLAAFEDFIVAGDYLLVHAGIDPALPLEEQRRSDMLWIREKFLRHEGPTSHVVVHGHTIFEDIEHRDHRIGIDTGAFRTGRLTALVLEGDRRRAIQAVATDDRIAIEKVELS